MDIIKILFLAADPSDTFRLRLGQELREIREKLQLSKQREVFVLESRESVRPGDITQAIHDITPQIVHFSGHGINTGELCFEDINGKAHSVQSNAISNLFSLMSKHVKCVILNACYSENQANAIANYIPYVIGMSQAIGDRSAIAFSTGFYKALGAGCTFEEAYKFGCVEIQLENIPGHLTPILHRKKESIDDLHYIERPPIEKTCFESIQRPGCLIRIKGCHQIGKTFLIQRIFSYAENMGYRTILLNLQLAEQKVVSNYDSFLRWFCISATRRLNLPNHLDEYWDDDMTSSICCTNYFEEYLLNHINEPVVLGVDELGWLFENPEVIKDFLGMLRAWHEMSKFQKSWRKLRVIITCQKEFYTERSINTSPFNSGILISLPEFTFKQVQDLNEASPTCLVAR